MASSEPITTPVQASPIARISRIALRSLSSTFVTAGTVAASAWLLGFWSLVVHARVSTGTWPRPSSGSLHDFRPSTVDPKAFGWHCDLVWFGLFAMYYAVPFAVLVLLASVPLKSMRQDRRLAGAFVVSTSLAALTVFLDPGSFFLWFLD